MRNILFDSNKSTQVAVADDEQLNFIVNVEEHISGLFKDLGISETVYKSFKPRGSRFEILYGLCKVHKQLVDNCSSFRLIVSKIKRKKLLTRTQDFP